MALKQVKNKISATLKTGKVTKAMEAVSAVKMRKSQERAFVGRPYVHSAMRILQQLSQSHEGTTHPLSLVRPAGTDLVVIVTSDKGLAGSVNSAVLKKAEELFTKVEQVDTICIGRKALEFAHREKKEVLASFTNVSDDISLEDVYEMSSIAVDAFVQKGYAHVYVLYQNFITTFDQQPTSRQVLPLDTQEIKNIMEEIRPKHGKFSENTLAPDKLIPYLIEPSAKEVLDSLIPLLVQIVLYHALIESKASEHSSRMIAMKNATDKSRDVARSLTLVYNRERQAAITAEVSEITGGIEAMKTS